MFESWIYSRSSGQIEIYERKQYLDRKWRMVDDYNKAPGGVQQGLSLWLDANDVSSMYQDEVVQRQVQWFQIMILCAAGWISLD